MSMISIDVNIRQIQLLSQAIEQIADEQAFKSRSLSRKKDKDISSVSSVKKTRPVEKRKTKDISDTKKLY